MCPRAVKTLPDVEPILLTPRRDPQMQILNELKAGRVGYRRHSLQKASLYNWPNGRKREPADLRSSEGIGPKVWQQTRARSRPNSEASRSSYRRRLALQT